MRSARRRWEEEEIRGQLGTQGGAKATHIWGTSDAPRDWWKGFLYRTPFDSHNTSTKQISPSSLQMKKRRFQEVKQSTQVNSQTEVCLF